MRDSCTWDVNEEIWLLLHASPYQGIHRRKIGGQDCRNAQKNECPAFFTPHYDFFGKGNGTTGLGRFNTDPGLSSFENGAGCEPKGNWPESMFSWRFTVGGVP